jgi:ubiquinone/menaquinone biosynthesis C-methylase UbiE
VRVRPGKNESRKEQTKTIFKSWFQMKPNERFTWAATVLNPQPEDRILEIGCGAGLLVEQIARVLGPGRIIALDRSVAMIRMAAKRNAASVSAGKAKFISLDFSDSKFEKSGFDKIVAFNVNFFWKDPKQELEIIKKILKPTGQLYIFYQAPTWTDIEATRPITENLIKNSFTISDTIFKNMAPTPAFCIKAKAIV